jgi:hypothetical protein
MLDVGDQAFFLHALDQLRREGGGQAGVFGISLEQTAVAGSRWMFTLGEPRMTSILKASHSRARACPVR